MNFAAPSGYLTYGNLSHNLEREKICDICGKPVTTLNPIQKRHPGKCMAEGRRRNKKVYARTTAARRRVA